MIPDSGPLHPQEGHSPHGWTPLLDAMLQGVILVDAEGRFLEANLAAAKILGLDRGTLLSLSLPEPWSNLSAADGSAFVVDDFPGTVALKTRMPVQRRAMGWVREDGSTLWLEVSAEPLEGAGALVRFDDITEHRIQSGKVEAEVLEAYQYNEQILRSAQEGIIVYDRELNYKVWNPFMEQLTGLPESAVLGKSPIKIFPFLEDTGVMERLATALGGEVTHSPDFPYYVPNTGKTGWTHVVCAPLRNARDEIIGVIANVHDITKLRKEQEELRRMSGELERRVKERTAQLEAANREMEAFSYSVSHDLRAPLRSIDGFSRILLEDHQDQVDEEGKHCLTRIRLGTQRMGNLIDDLLKLSKTSRSELTLSDFDLSRACGRVAGDLADLNPGRRVEVFIQPGMMVLADHRLMQAVLENLLGNAWKFTLKCKDPRIEVGETASPLGERTFFVRDNGAGFDMAHADKLFNAFQRLHSAAEYDGTGIGLAIVQRIINRHGGRVWAEAEPGQGATFFFTFPQRDEQ
jgi:PAS domain S-box-containing protein